MSTSRFAVILALVTTVAGCAGGSGEYAERMAAEHAGDHPVPTAAARREVAGEIEQREVVYASVDGREITGHLARPREAPRAGVILIHEWWGLNDNIRAIARQLAAEGYAALAVDLYRGESTADPGRARELMQAAMDRAQSAEQNLRQARDWLATRTGVERVGVIGWCFGGGWSLRTALLLGEQIDATVVYYGQLVADERELARLASPLLGVFGSEDRGIPPAAVHEFEQALRRLGKPATIHIYEGADHAFANPSGTRYRAQAAEDAWDKTLAFFAEHLRG